MGPTTLLGHRILYTCLSTAVLDGYRENDLFCGLGLVAEDMSNGTYSHIT